MKVIIMAGGKGTRIAELFPAIPKPLIPIEGIPILEREIISLKNQGFTEIIMTISYLADKISSYFGDGRKWGIHIEYYYEKVPLGSAGALYKIREKLTSPFLLLNADAVFDVDFHKMISFHEQHGGLITLLTHPNSHPYDSSLIVADADGKVEKWLSKEDKRPLYYKNRVNAGIHIMDPQAMDVIKNMTIIDLDRDILKKFQGTGKMFCYDSPEYVKDMGTPERYHSVVIDFQKGMIQAKNLSNSQKAVFLDRDGVINVYKGFLDKINDFELIPGVAKAIKMINNLGYLAIVITNQPVVARGDLSLTGLTEIHNKMETLLGQEGAYLDGIYFCPHHPDQGYEGEIPELKINCECRKPKPGMILKAAKDFNINLAQSYMIGDGWRDIAAGKSAGCKTALVQQDINKNKDDFGQDMTVGSLQQFVELFLQ